MIAEAQQIALEELDALSPEELKKVKELLAPVNPKTGERDYIRLLARLVAEVGSVAGVYLWRAIHLTGRSSKLEAGWFYKSREEMRGETGQGHREQEKARKILTGQKEYAGRTFVLLEERRPSRRQPTEYRAAVLAVAELLGVDVSSVVGESPRGATQGADEGGSGPESPRGATEPPRGATESPQETCDFIETSRENPTEIPLTGGADDSSSRPAPQQEEEDLEVSDSTPPLGPPKLDPTEDPKYRAVRELVFDPGREVGRLALQVIGSEGNREELHEELVGTVGRALHDPLRGEMYRARIRQAIEELEELEAPELAGMAS